MKVKKTAKKHFLLLLMLLIAILPQTVFAANDIDSAVASLEKLKNWLLDAVFMCGVMMLLWGIYELITSIGTDNGDQHQKGVTKFVTALFVMYSKVMIGNVCNALINKGKYAGVDIVLNTMVSVFAYTGWILLVYAIVGLLASVVTDNTIERAKNSKFFVMSVALIGFGKIFKIITGV